MLTLADLDAIIARWNRREESDDEIKDALDLLRQILAEREG
jgi:hypothetical protein